MFSCQEIFLFHIKAYIRQVLRQITRALSIRPFPCWAPPLWGRAPFLIHEFIAVIHTFVKITFQTKRNGKIKGLRRHFRVEPTLDFEGIEWKIISRVVEIPCQGENNYRYYVNLQAFLCVLIAQVEALFHNSGCQKVVTNFEFQNIRKFPFWGVWCFGLWFRWWKR